MHRDYRLLVATVPLTGHVHPLLVLVRALVSRGHAVTWYAASKFRGAIEAAGASFAPRLAARDWDDADVDAALPALRGKRGLGRVKAELREMFIAPMGDELRDLEALTDAFAPHAIVADQAHLGAALLAEKRKLPWVSVGISALVIPSVDTAPFGPGWRPPRGPFARRRNRFMNRFVQEVLFGNITRLYRDGRLSAGLPAGTGSYFDVLSPDLHLQPTIEAFEYPRSDLPPQVKFIGPLVAASAGPLPAWWPDVETAQVPVVLVTQGTLATDERDLILPALRALADEPVLVVATTGREGRPANARVAPFIPYDAILKRCAVMVTNGGYGGVQHALKNGVPLVVAGGSEEKPEIAARVAWSGAGIDLRTRRPSPGAIRRAVRTVLKEERYRRRAAEMAAEMAKRDAATTGAELIEGLL